LLKLLANAEGIVAPNGPLRENYHPLTGKGLSGTMFAWSAAHLLEMMTEVHAR